MSPRAYDSFMAALIRIGLLLALVIMLIAEKSQGQRLVEPMGAHAAGATVSICAQPPQVLR